MEIDMPLALALISMIAAMASGGVLKLVWDQVFGRKKRQRDSDQYEERAENDRKIHALREAEILQQLSAAFREEVRAENNELRERMDKVVNAVTSLTDLLDDLFPKMVVALTEDEREQLRLKINRVKRTT